MVGIDFIYEFIKQKYFNGMVLIKRFGEVIEYEFEIDWRVDFWSERFNVIVFVFEFLVQRVELGLSLKLMSWRRKVSG